MILSRRDKMIAKIKELMYQPTNINNIDLNNKRMFIGDDFE